MRSGEAAHVARLSAVCWGRWGSGQQVEGVLRAVLDFGEGQAAAGALVCAGPAQYGDGVGRVGNPEDAVGHDLPVVQQERAMTSEHGVREAVALHDRELAVGRSDPLAGLAVEYRAADVERVAG